MSKELRRLVALSCVMSLSLGLCAARPPGEGHEVNGTAGGGYHSLSPSCFGSPWRDETAEFVAHAHYTYRDEGWTFAAEAGMSVARVVEASRPAGGFTSGSAPYEEGDSRVSSTFALRGGYHGDIVGFELGPSFYLGHLEDRPGIFLSAMGWSGVPDVLYVYAEAFSGPHSQGEFNLGLGVGHDSDVFRFTTGFDMNGLRANAQLPVTPVMWVGAEFAASDGNNWDAFVTTSFRLGGGGGDEAGGDAL